VGEILFPFRVYSVCFRITPGRLRASLLLGSCPPSSRASLERAACTTCVELTSSRGEATRRSRRHTDAAGRVLFLGFRKSHATSFAKEEE
jgi:hypothetical protein